MGRKPNTSGKPERSGSVEGMEENMKKAVSEMLVLQLLSERAMYIGEIPKELEKRSGGVIHMVFPYSVIYRMQEFGYVEELSKRTAPDGRRRQYYHATPAGIKYLQELRVMFRRLITSIDVVMGEQALGEREEMEYAKSCGEAIYTKDTAAADMQPEMETSSDAGADSDDRAVPHGMPGCFA